MQGNNIIVTPINANTAMPDVYSILDAMEDAYNHPKKCIKFGKKARDLATDYSWDRVVDKHWVPILDKLPSLEKEKKKKAEEAKRKEFKKLYKKVKGKKKNG